MGTVADVASAAAIFVDWRTKIGTVIAVGAEALERGLGDGDDGDVRDGEQSEEGQGCGAPGHQGDGIR